MGLIAAPMRTRSGTTRGHLCDYLPADAWTVLIESDELHEQGKHYHERVTRCDGAVLGGGRVSAIVCGFRA